MRKRLRLPHFDYSSNGAYFITMCTHQRRPRLVGRALEIAECELARLTDRFPGLSLDYRKFMPDHLHAVLCLDGCCATLSTIVQAYKSITTREIRRAVRYDRVWQRGFYDRIVRDEVELAALREYIDHNDIVHALRGGASSAPTTGRPE